jgi:hypothetical protein
MTHIACMGELINATAVWFERVNLRHLVDFCTVGRIILKCVVKK